MSLTWVPRLGLITLLVSASCTANAQAVTAVAPTSQAAKDFYKAAALYYNPAHDGLDSFHCDAQFPWKSFLEKITGQTIPDDNERLKALNLIRMSIDDQLRGKGTITVDTSALPDNIKAGSDQMKAGLQQSVGGFFESWNSFMTGDTFAITDEKTKVEHTATGYRIWSEDGASLAEEHFDNNLLLLDIHVKAPSVSTTLHPTFEDTPRGKLVNNIAGEYTFGTGNAQTISMKVKYAEVSGFLLPSKLDVDTNGIGFGFTFTNCTIKTLTKK